MIPDLATQSLPALLSNPTPWYHISDPSPDVQIGCKGSQEPAGAWEIDIAAR